jgi:two-component system, sensor histidine kinase LadS
VRVFILRRFHTIPHESPLGSLLSMADNRMSLSDMAIMTITMAKVSRFLCALFITLVCAGGAFAGTTTAAIAYFVATTPGDSPDPPTYVSYTPSSGELSLGYQRNPVWIRVTLPMATDAKVARTSEIGIRVSPYQLPHVTFFELVDGRWRRTDAGAQAKRRSLNPCLDGQHCVKLNPKASGPIYVRVQTPTILTLSVEVLDINVLRTDSAARLASLSVSVTIAAGLLLFGLFFAASEKSRLSVAFLFLQSTVFLTLTGTNGQLAEWFPLFSPKAWLTVTHLALMGRTLAFAFLIHAIVRNYQSRKAFERLIQALWLIQLMAAVLILMGYADVAIPTNLFALMSLPPIALFGVLTARTIPANTRRVLVTGCLIFIFMLSWGVISSTNLIVESDNSAVFQGLADRKLSGLGVALFLLWFLINENTRQKLLKVEENQKLQLMISEAKQHEEATKERGMLIDMLTHEIKNPLGTIRFAVSALKSKLSDVAGDHERFRRLMASIDRIDGLLDHVALSNKLRHTDTRLETEQLDICQLIQDITHDSDQPERFKLRIPTTAYRVLNQAIFRVAIENLIVNAEKYSPPGTAIEVAIEPLGTVDAIRITVRNRLSPNAIPDLSQLFKPYYRHVTTSGQPGMGLGLGLVKSAIERLGGIIEARIDSEHIDFEITIP